MTQNLVDVLNNTMLKNVQKEHAFPLINFEVKHFDKHRQCYISSLITSKSQRLELHLYFYNQKSIKKAVINT